MKYLHKSQRLEYFGPQERDELMLLHGGGVVQPWGQAKQSYRPGGGEQCEGDFEKKLYILKSVIFR